MSTKTRSWTITTRFVPGGRWEAFVCEVDGDAADELESVGSAFGGGSTPYDAARQALARMLPSGDEEAT